MRIIRHLLNNRIRGAVLIVLSILLIGLIPIRTVFAASLEVSIPYRQTWSNESGAAVDNSFEYRLTAIDGAPLPDEAEDGYYQLSLQGNTSGELKLHFPFSKPGYYNYLVKAYIPERKADYNYEDTAYNLMIMVVNSVNGLGIAAMTIQDESLAKYPELQFETAYNGGNNDPGGGTEDGDGAEDEDGDGAEDRSGAEDSTENAINGTSDATDGQVNAVNGTSDATDGTAGGPENAVNGMNGATDGPGTPNTIEDTETPQGIFTEPDNWALLNLILMILTLAVAFMDAVLYFRKPTDKYGDTYEDEDLRRHGMPRIMAMITGIISLFLFIQTEDMTDPMIWVDEYTLWMLILFIAADILTVLSKKETGQDSNESVT